MTIRLAAGPNEDNIDSSANCEISQITAQSTVDDDQRADQGQIAYPFVGTTCYGPNEGWRRRWKYWIG